ncbi:MAG TPA: hypothetical protein V6C52_03105 [Coleofasciculaceae cyanobacterium]|jgi:hypothetical protein
MTMKRWQKILTVAVIALGLTASSLMVQPSHSQEAQDKRTMLYLFSTEFPPNAVIQNPIPPIQETRFWQLLDKEMQATNALALTQNLEEADYRVELRCSGIASCSRLTVDIKNMDRDVLASFTMKDLLPLHGLLGGKHRLHEVAHELTTRVDERLKLLQQGGYGHTE